MSTTCANYLEEVRDLGVPDLETTPGIKFINLARQEIVAPRRWTFRITSSAEATPPTTLSRLGTVLSVIDSENNKVRRAEKTDLEWAGLDLTLTGSRPEYYYLDSHQVITTYPIADVAIRYLKLPANFTATTDVEDLIPDEFLMAVAYRAAMHANLRVGVADLAREFGKLSAEAVDVMTDAYLSPIEDGPIRYPYGP
jgi:hypothetical protein